MANSSCICSPTTSIPFSPIKTLSRDTETIQSLSFFCSSKKKFQSSIRASYSRDYRTQQRKQRDGIWSIREDVQMPTSPYFPVDTQGGQGPPPMVQERFMAVVGQLFQHRIIRCGGAVDDDMANIIVGQLLYLDALDPTKIIDMLAGVRSKGRSGKSNEDKSSCCF